MGLRDLEEKLAQISMDCDSKDNVFGNSSVSSYEVVEDSPFKLDLEIAAGSRPRVKRPS